MIMVDGVFGRRRYRIEDEDFPFCTNTWHGGARLCRLIPHVTRLLSLGDTAGEF